MVTEKRAIQPSRHRTKRDEAIQRLTARMPGVATAEAKIGSGESRSCSE